jgi:diphosphomevalonate decarboxylase
MGRRATARAYANIALTKYWGKAGPLNTPATPSIGLSLDQLHTTTTVELAGAGADEFLLDGQPAAAAVVERLSRYLGLWRASGYIDGAVRVESANSFATGAGLASSASGFAALARALAALSGREIALSDISRLARAGSGSAARSVVGGLCALPAEPNPAALVVLPVADVPWGMVVAELKDAHKRIGSTAGMEASREHSPYYAAWLETAQRDYDALRLLCVPPRQETAFHEIGALMEANMYAMHACMLATRPALMYWHPATLELLALVRCWREDGLPAYCTVDAGAQVKVLCPRDTLKQVALALEQAQLKSGELAQVYRCLPAGPAELLADSSG